MNTSRILNIVYDLGPGGTQRNAQNFSVGFKSKGHEVAVLAYQSDGPRRKTLEEKRIEVFVGGQNIESFDLAVERAVNWCPDIVFIHSHGREQPEIFNIIKRIKSSASSNCRIIERNVFAEPSSYVDLVDVHWLLSRWDVWQWKCKTFSFSPKAICVAGANISEISRFYKPDNETRIRFRASHNIPAGAFVFGRIGQPHPLKWSSVVFNAFSEVARKEKNTYLLLVGLPSEFRPHLEGLPNELRNRVIEVPFIYGDDALRECYGAIDIFIHASEIGENCGNVLNEAMLCECPVITLSTPYSNNSQVEQIVHNECGFVVGRAQEFAQAMSTLMNDGLLRAKFAREGRRSVSDRYSMDSVMNTLERIIEIVIISSNRENIRLRLQMDDRLVTDVGTKEILALYENAFGRSSMLLSMLLRLRSVKSKYFQNIWPRLARKIFAMGV